MSNTDTQAMGILIRMLPLMQRELSLRVDPVTFFSDSGYREAILESALNAAEPRLQGYAQQMRQRLAELSLGPPGALRSAPQPPVVHRPGPRDFERTIPGSLDALPPQPARPASPPGSAPGTPPGPAPTDPARKYIGRLR
jgi:hypothetical protein